MEMKTKILPELKMLLKNDRGVALILIMGSIIILLAIYGEFTFESKISRIKATNILDRSQSKLLAESGLQLAMARLRLYKEAYNTVQSNPTAKQTVSSQLLNQLWEVPFMFPIPVGKDATRAFKDTVEKFQTETLLDGEMKVSIQNISNRMNLNLLRMDMTKIKTGSDQGQGEDDRDDGLINPNEGAIQTDVSIDQTLYFLLKRLVDEKKEKDEAFEDRYGTLNYQELISNLRYFMSDFGSLERDPMAGQSESTFQSIPLSPKYGPLGSASELYAIPGWTDELIELIKNEFSVYPAAQIDLNKLTANMLRILVPTINEEEVKEFFLYRDDPEEPKFFNTLADFKKYIVNEAHLMTENAFDERMALFQKKGISFGSNPNLFKIVAEGTYNRAIYTLVAYVVLPKQEDTKKAGQTGTQGGTQGGTQSGSQGGQAGTEQNIQLLEPRIIEIQIN
jgi:general secretion pathway protein K